MASVEPLTLASEALEVTLLPEIGGRLHRLRAFGHDLLRTPDDAATHRDDPFFWGAYPLAPWCNRARADQHRIAGRVAELVPNFADGTAIHGLVYAVPWQVDDDGSIQVEAGGDHAWPWRFAVTLRSRVEDATLTLDYVLTNHSDGPMPAGLGLHPWFRQPLELRVPAERLYATNTDSPSSPQPVNGELDLRDLAAPAPDLDATWTDLTEPVLELAWPWAGISARLEIEAPRPLVAVATPTDKGAAAIEPQTHGPDPLRRLAGDEPDAPVLLPPGAQLRLGLHLTVARARDLR